MPDPTHRPTANRALSPRDSAHVLMRCYIERAGEEALFRALLAERDMKRADARFWLAVYGRIIGER